MSLGRKVLRCRLEPSRMQSPPLADWEEYAGPPPPARWQRVFGGCLFLLLLAGLVSGATVWFTLYGVDEPVRKVADIERWTGVRFPPGTTLVRGKAHWGTEASVFADLTIPRRRVKQFVSQPAFTAVSRDGKKIYAHGTAQVTVDTGADDTAQVRLEWSKL